MYRYVTSVHPKPIVYQLMFRSAAITILQFNINYGKLKTSNPEIQMTISTKQIFTIKTTHFAIR